MDKLMEFLPFLIPLVIAELALFGYTLYHILTHKTYKRGSRALWLVITIVYCTFWSWDVFIYCCHQFHYFVCPWTCWILQCLITGTSYYWNIIAWEIIFA